MQSDRSSLLSLFETARRTAAISRYRGIASLWLSRREQRQGCLRPRRDIKDGARTLIDEDNNLAVERKVLIGVSVGFNVASYRA